MSKRKNWILNKLIPGILLFGGLLAVVVYSEWEQHILDKYPRYTVGYAPKTYWTVASGKQLHYEYKVGNEVFVRSNRYDDKSQVPSRYFVKYCEIKPGVSRIIQEVPVPDSIKVAPADGWKRIPIKTEQ